MSVSRAAPRRGTRAAVTAMGILCLLFCAWPDSLGAQRAQKTIQRVELMPDAPEPYQMRDWKSVARDYDRLVFDFSARGPYLPLIRWDRGARNFAADTFFLPSYVGDTRQQPGAQEAINTMAAVLGATLVGIDKSRQRGSDWVSTQAQYYDESAKLLLNNVQRGPYAGQAFWYELCPVMLFSCLVDRYPRVAGERMPLSHGGSMSMRDIMYVNAGQYYDAAYAMGGKGGKPDFNYTSFDFRSMEPVWNHEWREPDGAAGIAWIEYMAYVSFGEERFLQAADWAMGFLSSLDANPLYENLLPYGAYLAARMNAELQRSYDVAKLTSWCFGPSAAREGWGIIAERWGEYDVHGLMGSLTDGGGYAFAMNTFDIAGALVPLVRYEARYARAIGKWMLNLANNARLFYAPFLPAESQSTPRWSGDPGSAVAYEGLRKIWKSKSPYATGDSIRSGWGPTDLGLYGSSHVGILASLVEPTNVEKVLRIDLLATDHFHGPAYPSYLYYNPHDRQMVIEVDVGSERKDIYSPTEKRVLAAGVKGAWSLALPPRSAVVVVLAPAGGGVSYSSGHLLMGGVVVDYSPVSVVTSMPGAGRTAYGRQQVEIDAAAPLDVRLGAASVLIDGTELYNGAFTPAVEIDTARYPDMSSHEIVVRVAANSGALAEDSVRFVADNRLLSQNGARDFGTWKGHGRNPGRLEIRGYSATLTPEDPRGGAGSIISPTLRLDLRRNPVLVFDGFYPRGEWSLAIVLDGRGELVVAQSQATQDGYLEIDLGGVQQGRRSGSGSLQNVQLVLSTVGAGSSLSFLHQGVELHYRDEPPDSEEEKREP